MRNSSGNDAHLDGTNDFIRYYLRRYSSGGSRVLDVGCGAANYRDGVRGRYIGLDITTQPYGPSQLRRVDVMGSGTELPLAAGCLDLVFSKSAFYLLPDPKRALHEVHRVLKPGGRVLLFDYNRRTQRRFEKMEGLRRPCWTQWGLRSLVRAAGFRQSRLLIPKDRDVSLPEYWLRLLHQEWFGTWAIVTAVK